MNENLQAIIDAILSLLAKSPAATFTIEIGQGNTYRGGIVLYGHDEYPEGSVLEGQPRRMWLDRFETWDEANTTATALRQALPSISLDVNAPSTYISADELCDRAGLHDEYTY